MNRGGARSRTKTERGRDQMNNLIMGLTIWKDRRGQDLIEYALMAAFVAVAAGATIPNVAVSISQIFSKVASVVSQANNTP
jgi:pilus assembly protein Flp/PilA